MAVLEMSESPGRASRMDWAFFLGSSAGTLDEWRLPEAARVVMAGTERIEIEGRRRAAPAPVAVSVQSFYCQWHCHRRTQSYSPSADLAKRDAIVMCSVGLSVLTFAGNCETLSLADDEDVN